MCNVSFRIFIIKTFYFNSLIANFVTVDVFWSVFVSQKFVRKRNPVDENVVVGFDNPLDPLIRIS